MFKVLPQQSYSLLLVKCVYDINNIYYVEQIDTSSKFFSQKIL